MTDCIPKEIAKAICAVMATIEAVKKSTKNTHGGYMFASTDDIYAAVTRRQGEVGLLILPLQVEHELKTIEKDGKTVRWLAVTYQMVLSTADGATWTHENCKRSLFVQYNGPQTHQAAESYAKKQFIRGLFQLPTGDMDLDSMPQADTEEGQVALITPRKRKSSYAAKKDGETPEKYNDISKAIAEAISREMLMHVWENYADDLAGMPFRWAGQLSEEYEDKMQSFGAFKEAAE